MRLSTCWHKQRLSYLSLFARRWRTNFLWNTISFVLARLTVSLLSADHLIILLNSSDNSTSVFSEKSNESSRAYIVKRLAKHSWSQVTDKYNEQCMANIGIRNIDPCLLKIKQKPLSRLCYLQYGKFCWLTQDDPLSRTLLRNRLARSEHTYFFPTVW